eukprot:scaffold203224_cov45-Attheya_sp.AAC.1
MRERDQQDLVPIFRAKHSRATARDKEQEEKGTSQIWSHFSGRTFQNESSTQKREGRARFGTTRERDKVSGETGTSKGDSKTDTIPGLYYEARMQRNNIWQRECQVNEKTTKLTINKYMRERRKQQVQ